ncbi:hypothetical protein [Xenorhabdus bovienii]|uniref:Phage protein n=1 Tax=Xenorhabdus bovienii TaxID=40576 RepID=A0A0B6XCA7_XENBV|nr:hypothetical protein [Xenorhabdus bovienii]CDM90383.1 phage protein [Xenorhabdus bovienii]
MATNVALPDGFVLDSDNSVNSVPSLPDGFVLDSQQQAPQQSERGFFGDVAAGLAETGKSLAQAGVNVANIIPDVGDAVVSAGAWAGEKIGLGDGTYTPATRFELPDNLKPTTTEGKVLSQALPFLANPAGTASRGAALTEKAARLAAENAVGVLAENAGKGENGNLATDLMTATALSAATKGLFNLAGAGYRGIKGAMTPEAQQAVQFAERNNVPLMTTDVVQPATFAGRSAQALGEKIPITGTGAPRRAQQQAREGLVRDYSQRYGEPNAEEVINSLTRKSGSGGYIREAAGNRLSNISRDMSPIGNIQTNRTLTAIDSEIAHLGRLGEVSDQATIAQLQRYRNEIANGANFQHLRDLRTQFRQDVRGERVVWPSQSEASVNRAYRAMTEDIDASVRGNLGNEAARRYQQANEIYAREAVSVNNTRLKNVLQKGELTPEMVNNLLFSNKRSEVARLYRSLDEQGRRSARAAIIGKAFESSGGSPDKFLNAVNRLGNQTGIFFRGQERQYLNGLTQYLDSTRRASRAGAVTPTGQELLQVGIPAGVATDFLGTGGMGTAAFGSYGALARVYENPRVRNFMLRLANTRRGSTAADAIIERTQSLVNSILQGERAELINKN